MIVHLHTLIIEQGYGALTVEESKANVAALAATMDGVEAL